MATYNELRQAIDKVAAIDVEGFDSDWLLRAFARKQALINIKLIEPYTGKYALIVRYLVTGDESIRAAARKAAYDAAVAAADIADVADTDVAADAVAAADIADVAAAAYVSYAADTDVAAAYVSYAADTDVAAARDKAIIMLNEMVEEHLALLTSVEEI